MNFPRVAGVYIMRDAGGEVIYVGKAKSLRERVRSYFSGNDERAQVAYLLERVADIENIVTGTEQQAFVLERDLIAKYKPRYNIRLKDDKAYLSIRLDESAAWPKLELVRRIADDGARYYGPYSFGHELRTLLDVIKRAVPLRSCSDTVFYNRQRPCLEFQIKRCVAPCCLAIDRGDYLSHVKEARAILEGRTEGLVRMLHQKMEEASTDLRFEDAATYRDRISALESVREGQQLVSPSGEDRDVFALYREERLAVISILKVRHGRISDSKSYAFRDLAVADEEILEASLSQYYEANQEIPDEIVLPFEFANQSIVESGIAERAGRKITMLVPKQGVKARLLGLAELNAKQFFLSSFDSESRQGHVAKALAQLLKLRQIPRKIECVDISNFQGSDIVGALVCFFDGQPFKEGYRKYKIQEVDSKPDDFASVAEVVRRRLERGRLDEDLPDLVVIDGGAGQLKRALEERDKLGLSLDIVALAKERTESNVESSEIKRSHERIFVENNDSPIELPFESELTNFMKRLRDETHRFVITFHRATRGKRAVKSALDDIAGVGPERRSRLLRSFGSVDAIAQATAEEVARTGRMPLPLAQKILRILTARS